MVDIFPPSVAGEAFFSSYCRLLHGLPAISPSASFRIAKSFAGSLIVTLATTGDCCQGNCTVISSAPSTTCQFVATSPSLEIRKPVPELVAFGPLDPGAAVISDAFAAGQDLTKNEEICSLFGPGYENFKSPPRSSVYMVPARFLLAG